MPPLSTVLVTGATQGIGRATAAAFGQAGYRVGVCARTEAAVDALVAELRADGVDAAGARADVADPGQVRAAVARIVQEIGEVGVLVNNAGVLIARPFEELSLDDWDVTMATNVRSLFLMTREVLPAM